MRAMRVVFFGSSDFSCPTLRAIASDPRFEVALVVTQPDARSGRGQNLSLNPVRNLADELGLKTHQPPKVGSPDSVAVLKGVEGDVLLTAAYGQKLSKEVLSLAKAPPLNLHASLLPRHRGASPVHHAILCGDRRTGVSLMEMTQRMDAGPVFARKELAIENHHTAGFLEQKLALHARDLFLEKAADVCSGRLKGVPQEESEATLAPLLEKELGRIRWSKTAEEIDRHVRAMTPWPGAFTFSPTDRSPTRLIIVSGEVLDLPSPAMPGTVVAFTSGIEVATQAQVYRVLTVKRSGKKELPAAVFLRGFPIPVGTRLT